MIQMCGRAARNIAGEVIMYSDSMTRSITSTLRETNRRRKVQAEFNTKNNITPEGIQKSISNILASVYEGDYYTIPLVEEPEVEYMPSSGTTEIIKHLKEEMKRAAKKLEFEKAAELRDRIKALQE